MKKKLDFLKRTEKTFFMTRSSRRKIKRILKKQEKRFTKKFGRKLGLNNPLFFDEDSDTPRFYSKETQIKMHQEVVRAMLGVGVQKHIIHAYNVTTRMVSEANIHLLSEEDLKEWEDAVDEYLDSPESFDVENEGPNPKYVIDLNGDAGGT